MCTNRPTLRIPLIAAALFLTLVTRPLIAAPPPNDSCATPLSISGPGPFPFDLTQATTGTEGQNIFCVTQGPPAITNDLWYCWTAECNGLVTVSTCGQTNVDTKISFYIQGCTCPAQGQQPLCCGDDGCGANNLQTTFSCEVTCGNKYLIHIGTKPGAPPGTGTFTMTCNGSPCPVDQCTDCCGKKPNFAGSSAFANFPAQVLIATTQDNGYSSQPYVIHMIDAQTPILYSPPQNWFATFYNHPSWTQTNLGTIFGETLDDLGNIYVAHTSIYGSPGSSGYSPSDALGFGGAGAIYKIDTNTALPSLFAVLPNFQDPNIAAGCPNTSPPPLPSERWPGLGDICFDCQRQKFYVTDFENGKIYILNTGGSIVGVYDQGAPDNGLPGFAPLGERVWAVKTSQGRLYYSIWAATGQPNRVWSVPLDGAGMVSGPAQLEISYPTTSVGQPIPIADIAFSPKCCMLLAERTMYCDTESSAHASSAREFCFDQATQTWQPGNPFNVGVFSQMNSAGGCAWDFNSNGRVWVSGDALLFGPDINYLLNTQYVYGLQGFPPTGGDTNNSALIDLDQNVSGSDKFQMGDVEVSCGPAVQVPVCHPDPSGQTCAGTCQIAGIPCVPVEITRGVDGIYRITKCDCVDTCHVEMGPAGPICVNACPMPGLSCHIIAIANTDGSVSYSCRCDSAPGCQLDPLSNMCVGTCPNGEPCVPTEITFGTDGVYRVTKCGCVTDCHVEMGPVPGGPICVNPCPTPGMTCHLKTLVHPDGSITYFCKCEQDPPPPCHPDPLGQTCTGQCSPAGLPCVPVEITLGVDGVFRITRCDCIDTCHVELGAAGPYCVNACPQGFTCALQAVANADGSVTYTCKCTPIPPPPCQPDPLGQTCTGQCSNGTGLPCVPIEITRGTDGIYRVTKCDCVATCHVEMGPAGPFCVNTCPLPGQVCQLMARGNLDGSVSFSCNCRDDVTPPDCGLVSICDVNHPGSCYKACSGNCPQGYACYPVEVRENPPHSGVFEVTDCNCMPLVNPPCHPVVVNGLVRCIGSCPGGQPCKLIATYEMPTPILPQGAVRYRCECVCYTPPANMVGWWPLNENPATSAKDLAGFPNNGSIVGSVSSVAGCVGNAFSFNGVSGYVNVPNHATLNFGLGNFSMDAWVRTTQTNGIASIVDKRVPTGPSAIGYSMFLFNGNLSFQLADGAHFNYISTLFVADGQCHHVAVSLTRNSTTGLQLFVDGVAQSFNPTARSGSVNSNSPLFIGTHAITPTAIFNGLIDELELFNRALTSAEVIGIYSAGMVGKCRDGCYLPNIVFCKNEAAKAITITVCNYGTTGATYNWTLAGPVGGAGCAALGATTITPTAGSVFVPAGGCVNVAVNMTRPVGMPNTPPICGCYQLTIQNLTTGNSKTCTATICNSPLLCVSKKDYASDMSPIRVGAQRTIAVNVSNMIMNPPATTLDYRWVAIDAEDGTYETQAISLNGLPPGTPVIGSVTIPAGGVIMVMLSVQFLEDAPLRAYVIKLEADLDGDGIYDPVDAVGVRSVVGCVTETMGDIDEDGTVTTADVPLFVQALLDRPVDPYHLISSDVNCDGHADGEDVRTMVQALLGP